MMNNPYLHAEAIQSREYQMTIAEEAIDSDSLVVIPTGLGKTIVAVLIAAQILNRSPETTKIVMLAPTRPLIHQHFEAFQKFLTLAPEDFTILTGSTSPKQREKLFASSRVIFFTPQTLRNDLLETRYNLSTVGLLIFDEAHRASGNYAYCQIASLYQKMAPDGRTLALTASPGSTKEKIETLCDNLHISTDAIIIRTRSDQDVRPYLKPMDIVKMGVHPTKLMNDCLVNLTALLHTKYTHLQKWRVLDEDCGDFSRIGLKTLINLTKEYQQKLQHSRAKVIFTALSLLAQAQKVRHMISLVEQQGMDLLLKYLEQMKEKVAKGNGSKADQYLLRDPIVYHLFQQMLAQERRAKKELFHPKFNELVKVISQQFQTNPNARILVFAKLRSTVSLLVKRLNTYENCRAIRFVGQATKSKKDQGLSQKEQIQIVQEFKENIWNILVSTNVAEEGLDIAECDLVIFYDTVASEIRLIQRRGRTARTQAGKVLILYCIGTSDEVLLHISLQRLNKMQQELGQKTQNSAETREEIKTILHERPSSCERAPPQEELSPIKAKQSRPISGGHCPPTRNIAPPSVPIAKMPANTPQKMPRNTNNSQEGHNDRHSQGAYNDRHSQGAYNDRHSQGAHNDHPNQGAYNDRHNPSLLLAKETPLHYGLRKLGREKGLKVEIKANQWIDMQYADILGCKFFTAVEFAEAFKDGELVAQLQKLRQNYRVFIVFVDLLFFEEEFLGHQAKILRDIGHKSDQTGIKILAIMNIRELRTILGGMFSKLNAQSKLNGQGGRA